MEHDVEADAERQDERGVPTQEEGERSENLLNIVSENIISSSLVMADFKTKIGVLQSCFEQTLKNMVA